MTGSKNTSSPLATQLSPGLRFVSVASVVLVWVVVTLITGLVWAWRDSAGTRIVQWVFALEVVGALFFLTVGRNLFWRLAAQKLRAWKTWWGKTILLAVVFLAFGFLARGFQGAGEPVLDAEGHTVAIVGAGAAGLHAAWALDRAGIEFDVYEAADYIGGHAYAPVFTPERGEPFACDIGFIFGSPTDYQEIKVLMDWYGIERTTSQLGMSGNVDGYEWASGPEVDSEAKRFHQLAQEQHQQPKWNLVPFGAWLNMHDFDQSFRDRYLTPMMSVLFITDMGLYNVSTRFMLNMAAGRMQWIDFLDGAPAWTMKGGSVAYYEKLAASYLDRIQLNTAVASVERKDGKVHVSSISTQGERKTVVYDDVILAVPGDVAHTLVKNKDWLEDLVLSQVRYKDSEVVLHTDDSLLPAKKFQRQYNYYQDTSKFPGEFELTGIMNLVHDAGEMSPLPIGSLNPLRPIDPDKILLTRGWRHHSMDLWHLALMLEVMPSIQGRGGVWYAGDWVTVIGHGPAMRTGIAAACNVGVKNRVKRAADGARCIDVRTEEARAGLPAVDEHICGEEEILEYLVERNCNGFKL